MIDKEQALACVRKLAGLNQSPDPDVRSDLRREVGLALMGCSTMAHAEATIEHLLSTSGGWFPDITRVRDAIEAKQPAGNAVPPDGACSACHGTGYARVEPIRGRTVFSGMLYPAVRRCHCASGAG